MKSSMAWVQRQTGIIKVEGSASALNGSYLVKGRECCIEANINNRNKSLSDMRYGYFELGYSLLGYFKSDLDVQQTSLRALMQFNLSNL
jgi:hypothetical protein